MSDLISREEVKKVLVDNGYGGDFGRNMMLDVIDSIPSAYIIDHARAIKEYCKEHRNEHNFYMCDTCKYAPSEYSSSLHEKPYKCPFNVPAYWDLPEGEKGGK